MVSIHKIMGVLSCGFVLCLSPSNVTQADHKMDPAACADRKSGPSALAKCDAEAQQGIRRIQGEILHINGPNLLVKQSNGDEVILHIDLSTQTGVHLAPGISIEAKVNEVEGKTYALSISQTR
ncbi:MAG TPA: hypothetical protein VLA67_10005 [Nitrospiraceae bacterium]|nr:hypothetical protein [Nitrospiraceae bacterium]